MAQPAANPGLPALCLVIDDSASTTGAILQSELEAAVALLETARKLHLEASVVVFGSDVTAAIEPGSSYDDMEMLLASLEGNSGGTRLAPALRRALSFVPSNQEPMATVVFTDSHVFDVERSVPLMGALLRHGPLLLFCADTRLDQELVQAVAELGAGARMVQHRPGQPLTDEALRVYSPDC